MLVSARGGRAFGALVVAAAAWATQAVAAPPVSVPGSTICKPFSGGEWANPYPPHEVGNHYQVFLLGKAFTCASAGKYVKTFVTEHIKPMSPTGSPEGVVKHGPKGYKCRSGIGYTGTAYQGQCNIPNGGVKASGFSWSPYKDS
jgi:hypothetical protein